MRSADDHDTFMFSESNLIDVEPLNSVPMEMYEGRLVTEDNGFNQHDAQKKLTKKSSLVSRVRSNNACRNYQVQSNSLSKISPQYPTGKSKTQARKPVNVKLISERLSSKEACDELLAYEVCE